MKNWMENKNRFHEFSLFTLFLMCGVSVFVFPILIKEFFNEMCILLIPIFFLIASTLMYRNKNLKKYFPVILAFSIASLVYTPQLFLGPGTSIEEKVYTIVFATMLVVVPILLVTKASGKNLSSIYIKKGNLRLGLIIGFMTFVFFLMTSLPASIWIFGGRNVSSDRLITLIPSIAIFVFSNAIKEEILFRGFFLKKYEYFLGPKPSNFLQAAIFSLAHLYLPLDFFLPIYVIMTFILGFGFGAVMQKTDSVLAAILFHAGADIPVILSVFSILS